MVKFENQDLTAQYRRRTTADGPESRLLSAFMTDYGQRLEKKGGNYAIFYEPKLPTGYPDCVIVEFDSSFYANWSPRAIILRETDFKVLHILASSHGMSEETLAKRSGFPMTRINRSLERLARRGMVINVGCRWTALPKKQISGVRQIVAIEAKMSDCRQVMDQAYLNQTFANVSYVLTAAKHPTLRTLNAAHDVGIGVFTLTEDGKCRQVQRAVVNRKTPPSYSCWYFNEWIGRRMAKERKIKK